MGRDSRTLRTKMKLLLVATILAGMVGEWKVHAVADAPKAKGCPLLLRPLCVVGKAIRRACTPRWKRAKEKKPDQPPPGHAKVQKTEGAATAAVVAADGESLLGLHREHAGATVPPLQGVEDMTPPEAKAAGSVHVSRSVLGGAPEDPYRGAEVWTLEERITGATVSICTLGATIVELWVPDRQGDLDDVVLGFPASGGGDGLVGGYLSEANPYFGAVVGRVANRIAGAAFTLGGEKYSKLAANNGRNTLHGGTVGFNKRLWGNATAVSLPGGAGAGVSLSLLSPDGEEGFPGELLVTATYTLGEAKASASASASLAARLELLLEAKIVGEEGGSTASPVNLAQHSYFNLAGHHSSHRATAAATPVAAATSAPSSSSSSSSSMPTVDDHVVFIAADTYTPVDGDLIPTGELRRVDSDDGGVFDLRDASPAAPPLAPKLRAMEEAAATAAGLGTATRAGVGDSAAAAAKAVRDAAGALMAGPIGFDHNFVLRSPPPSGDSGLEGSGGRLQVAAIVRHPASGRVLTVETDAPGVQFYTGNFLDGTVEGKHGASYGRHSGLCLETQYFPSSVGDVDAATNPVAAAFAGIGSKSCAVCTPTIHAGGPAYTHRIVYTFGIGE
jgi:aldose 1-epimerase